MGRKPINLNSYYFQVVKAKGIQFIEEQIEQRRIERLARKEAANVITVQVQLHGKLKKDFLEDVKNSGKTEGGIARNILKNHYRDSDNTKTRY
jgi:hypothetical protein